MHVFCSTRISDVPGETGGTGGVSDVGGGGGGFGGGGNGKVGRDAEKGGGQVSNITTEEVR